MPASPENLASVLPFLVVELRFHADRKRCFPGAVLQSNAILGSPAEHVALLADLGCASVETRPPATCERSRAPSKPIPQEGDGQDTASSPLFG